MRRLLMLTALVAVGCGSESAPPSPTPARAPTYPAAYLIDAGAARRLADADDPFLALERDGA